MPLLWLSTEKKMAKRANVAKEILSTERQYVANLKILVQVNIS